MDLELVNSEVLQNHRLCTRTNLLLLEAWLLIHHCNFGYPSKALRSFLYLIFFGYKSKIHPKHSTQTQPSALHQSKTGKERERKARAEAIFTSQHWNQHNDNIVIFFQSDRHCSESILDWVRNCRGFWGGDWSRGGPGVQAATSEGSLCGRSSPWLTVKNGPTFHTGRGTWRQWALPRVRMGEAGCIIYLPCKWPCLHGGINMIPRRSMCISMELNIVSVRAGLDLWTGSTGI